MQYVYIVRVDGVVAASDDIHLCRQNDVLADHCEFELVSGEVVEGDLLRFVDIGGQLIFLRRKARSNYKCNACRTTALRWCCFLAYNWPGVERRAGALFRRISIGRRRKSRCCFAS